MAKRTRETMQLDGRGRTYLTKLGYERGTTIVAEPMEGDDTAWILRPGRIVTDVELAIIANESNIASMARAAAEYASGDFVEIE